MTTIQVGQTYYDLESCVFYTVLSRRPLAPSSGLFWRVLLTHPPTGRSTVLDDFKFPAPWAVDATYRRVA